MVSDVEAHLPTFIIIGAMKCGTTSLHLHLKKHPDISMSAKKETDYFLGPDVHQNSLEWYASQFDPAKSIRGESSTNYTKIYLYPGVPERIHAMVPDVQLVFTARDPISRIASDWMHNRSNGRETRTFAKAIRQDPKYVDTSSYARQLAPYVELFGRDKLLIVDAQTLKDDTDDAVRTVVEFVGAKTDVPLDTSKVHHVTERKTEPSSAHRQLRRLGLHENRAAAKLVDALPGRFRARQPVVPTAGRGRGPGAVARSAGRRCRRVPPPERPAVRPLAGLRSGQAIQSIMRRASSGPASSWMK